MVKPCKHFPTLLMFQRFAMFVYTRITCTGSSFQALLCIVAAVGGLLSSKVMYCTSSKNSTPFRAVNISSFQAIIAEMYKNLEGGKCLDYSGETLERRRNFRAVSLDALLA